MANNTSSGAIVYDAVESPACVTVVATAAYTVGPNDNVIICGANSLAITLDATSNSPVYITSIDGELQRTGCTIVVGDQNYVIADSGCAAECKRIAGGSSWIVIGAKTAS